MKSRIGVLAMVLLVVVVLVGWTTQARSSARNGWEYRVVFSDPDTVKMDLNTLGADGWELVSILPDTVDGNSRGARFYFKRPK